MQHQLKTLMISDLVNSTHIVEKLGTDGSSELFSQHDRLARDLFQRFGGQEIDKSDGFLVIFDRPIQALSFAMQYHADLMELGQKFGVKLMARVGIHLDEVILRENSDEDISRGAKPIEIEGIGKPITARIMSLAIQGQTLLSRSAFDLARKTKDALMEDPGNFFWQAHGSYKLKGVEEPVAIYEVGRAGVEPRVPPTSSSGSRLTEDGFLGGWRPASGLRVPQRKQWELVERLEQGFFGEVWLARHEKSGEDRVFKFCFEEETLRALKREVTLFRLLKDSLSRTQLIRILEWSFDEEPFFLEMEYMEGGNLNHWLEYQGRIPENASYKPGIAALPWTKAVPLETRLEIVAQIADALAEAHSVGVLHKDIKPGNILLAQKDGPPEVRLGDFGIGKVFDKEQLHNLNITAIGMTELHLDAGKASHSGTRLYMAPELIEGRLASVQSDIYALGVLLFQLVVGDMSRSIAPGWERDVSDDLLRQDIAWLVEGDPKRRLGNVRRIAENLRALEQRRKKIAEEQTARAQAEANRLALQRVKRMGILAGVFVVVLIVFSSLLYREMQRANHEAEKAQRESQASREITAFLLDLFEESEPGSSKARSLTAQQLLDNGARRIRQELRNQPETQARMMGVMGQVYEQIGALETAQSLVTEAATIALDSLGPGDDLTVEAHLDLAGILLGHGDLDGTRKLLDTDFILEGAQREISFKIRHLTLEGELNKVQGHYDQAISFLKQAIQLKKSQPNTDPETLASTHTSLAEVYWLQARHDMAEPLLADVLKIRETHLGDHHLKTGQALNNLAAVYRELGRHQEAIELYQRALKIFDDVLSPYHPQKASVLNNLATAYNDLDQYGPAEPLFVRALEIRKKDLDPNHPALATSMNNLAFHYARTKQYDKALDLNYQALAIREKALGPEHRDVALSLHNIGRIKLIQGQKEEALPLLKRALEIREKTLGIEHPDYAESLKEIGTCLLQMDQADKAVPYLQNALEILNTSQQKRAMREWRETAKDLESALEKTAQHEALEALRQEMASRLSADKK